MFLANSSNLEVKVYEAAGQFKEIGAGVILWARTWRIMQEMGLADQFAKFAHATPSSKMGVGFDYRKSDQPEEGFRFQLVDMPCEYKSRYVGGYKLLNNLPLLKMGCVVCAGAEKMTYSC